MADGRFVKGQKKPNQGKRGPAKATKELKEMILAALDESGGVQYLVERANDPKTASAFLSLIGKVLPMQVTGADGAALTVQIVKYGADNPATE